MADASWINNMKKIIAEDLKEKGLCEVCFGTVVSVNPLKIAVGQRDILRPTQLVVGKGLTDHQVPVTLPGQPESMVTVKNGLKTGEKVILLQRQGGQSFLVLDRY